MNHALKMCEGPCMTSSEVEVYIKHLALVRCNPSLLTVHQL